MKKITALILAVMMIVSFAGCGSKQTANDGEPVKLTWIYGTGHVQTDLKLVQDAANEIIREKIGAEVEFISLDNAAYTERIGLMMASGEEFDICWVNSSDYITNANKGAYVKLDELLKDRQDMWNVMPEEIWDGIRVNGDIYAVPNYQIIATQKAIYTTAELDKKYNFDFSNVKKIKDMEPILAQLKKDEPSRIPYLPSIMDIELEYEVISPTKFAVVDFDSDPENVKVLNMYELPEWKEYNSLMHDWFKKGYVQPVIEDVTYAAKAAKYGFFWADIKPGSLAEAPKAYNCEMMAYPIGERYSNAAAVLATANAISRTSKNPEKALELLELVNTDKELYNLLVFGIEGKHYEKIGENRIKPVENSTYRNSAWLMGCQFNAYFLEGQEETVWEETKEYNATAKRSPLWGFTLDTNPIKTEIAQTTAIADEYEYISMGQEDPENVYDEFFDKMEKAGMSKIIDEIQRQVDEFIKNK